MFDGTIETPPADKQQELLESLRELERNVPDAIRRKRGQSRVTFRSRVLVRPANMSERDKPPLEGITGDISGSGCQMLLKSTLLVGDVYEIEFDRSQLNSTPVVARCLRVRLIGEDAFEVGFSFFSPVDITDLLNTEPEEDLV